MGLSMNETDTAKLAEVETKLLTLKDNIAVYDSDSPKSSLISGDCNVGYCWAAEVALAMDENPSIKIVFLKRAHINSLITGQSQRVPRTMIMQ